MLKRERKYSSDEMWSRAGEIFERKIRAKVEHEDPWKYLLIDVDSEDFEVDHDELSAGDRLRARHPEAQIVGRRVGSPYARHFGGSQWPTED